MVTLMRDWLMEADGLRAAVEIHPLAGNWALGQAQPAPNQPRALQSGSSPLARAATGGVS